MKRNKPWVDEEKIIINGEVCDRTEYDPDADSSKAYVYDVIRVIDGRPLFATEHYERIKTSLRLTGRTPSFDLTEMCRSIELLVQANRVRNDNVKIIVDEWNGATCVVFVLMHASYPDETAYREGVATELFSAVRSNPHIKSRNQLLRNASNEIIRKHGLYEVLLVDEQGCVTEGSRSNLFFIKEGIVYTCHEAGVLLGITRQKIIDLCMQNGIEVIERAIPASSLGDYEAAFISGTSPKVLPIRTVGDIVLDVHNATLCEIMKLYDQEIERSY